MIRRNQKLIRFLNLFSDALLLFLSYFLAVYLRYSVLPAEGKAYSESAGFYLVLGLYSLVLPLLYYAFRGYAQSRLRDEAGEFVTVALCNAGGALFLGTLLYLFRVPEVSRTGLLLFWAVSTLLVVFKHFCGHRVVGHFRSLGYNQRHVIVIGSGPHARNYVRDISREKRRGYTVDGYVAQRRAEGLGKYLGAYAALEQVLEQYDPDEAVIAVEPGETCFMTEILSAVGKEGVHVSLVPFYNDVIPPHPEIESIGSTRLINLRATPLDSLVPAALKRLFDVCASLGALVLLSPALLLVALGVKLSSPGPVFFRQERVGKDKKPFYMLKFRSMRVNAEENTAWSTNSDPRKTRFGSFIRKYSIDELPQLWNVLKGEMSLVGPRPEIPYYVRQFKETVPLYLVRQQVRPGMTGWAQVHDLRGDTSIEARVEYDIWYIENWSLRLDAKILFRTVFKGKFVNKETLNA